MAEQDRRRVVIAEYLDSDYTPIRCPEFHRLMVSRLAAQVLLDLSKRRTRRLGMGLVIRAR